MVEQIDSASLHKNDDYNIQLNGTYSTISQLGNTVALQQSSDEENTPTFGNVSVTNSNDVHFGNKTFYQGPVTIQQFVYANEDERLKKISESDAVNPEKDLSDILVKNFKTGIDNPCCDVENVVKNNDDKVPLETDKNVLAIGGNPLKEILSKHRLAIGSTFSLVSMLLLIILMLLLFARTENKLIENEESNSPRTADDEHDHNTPIKAPTDPVSSLKPLKLKIVTRLEWLAQPPSNETDPLETPVPYVIISHTATENCSSQAQCVFQVRYIQTFHMESRGWWDIGYNFLVGGDGEVYYGRGWEKEGSHTFGYNVKSIGIAFIGTFINSKPPEYQLIACKKLIAKGVELGYIKSDYKLLGARQLQTTQSPGEELYKEIQTWPHWAESP